MGKGKKLLLFFILAIQTYSYEEAYIQIKSKKIQNDFYMVYYEEEKEEIYLGVKSLVNFLRIGTLKVDEKKMVLKGTLPDGEKLEERLDVAGSFEEEDDIYVPLKEAEKIFKFSPSRWDRNNLSLEIEPEYKLPYEVRAESEANRIRFDNKRLNGVEEDYERLPSTLFSPGILLLRYSNGDFLNNGDNYNFDIQYGTQLLYGDFELSQTVAPDTELDFVRLKYRDIWKGNYLLLGDNFIQMDTPYSTESNIRGLYFGKREIYGYSDNNQTIIQGQVFNASLVELYRDSSLIDYKRISGNNFQFIVNNISGNDVYTLKIFYTDGRIEVRDVNVVGMTEILAKGESDYLLQGGKTVDGKGYQYLGKYKYGLTHNLTLGIGAGKLEASIDDEDEREDYDEYEDSSDDYIGDVDEEERSYTLLEGTMAYRTSLKYPTTFAGSYLRDVKNGQNGYKGRIEQMLGRTLSAYGEYERYDEVMAEDQEKDTGYSAGIDKEFPSMKLNSSIGFTRESYLEYDDDYYFLNLSYMGIRNTGIYLYNKYFIDMDGKKGYGADFQVNYYGFKYVDILGDVKYDFDLSSDNSSDENREGGYGVKFVKKIVNESTRWNDFDLDLEMRYSTVDKFMFGLNFTYYMDNWVYIETPITYDKGENVGLGLQVQKAIPLGAPLKKVSNTSVSDFWVTGTAFADYNGNGIKEREEPVIPQVGVMIGSERGETNDKGEYTIMNLVPDSIYSLEVDGETLDAMSRAAKQNFRFKGRSSTGHKIDIPIVPVSVIGGNIVPPPEMSEKELLQFLVGVDIVLKQEGKEIKRTRPEQDGYYYFEEIAPGRYEIELDIVSDKDIQLDRKTIEYKVNPQISGDYYEGLNFNILP